MGVCGGGWVFSLGVVAGFAWYRGWVCLVMVVAKQGLLCDGGSRVFLWWLNFFNYFLRRGGETDKKRREERKREK